MPSRCWWFGHGWRQLFEQTGWNAVDETPRIQPMGFYCTRNWRHRDA